jgi:hypothetical protein
MATIIPNQLERLEKTGSPVAGDVVKEIREGMASADQIQAARDLYQTDECEIDDDASTSEADEGYWVQAWVWVSTANEEGDDA